MKKDITSEKKQILPAKKTNPLVNYESSSASESEDQWDFSYLESGEELDFEDGKRLTSLVRKSYMGYLNKTLNENCSTWLKNNNCKSENTFSETDIAKCSMVLERKALRACAMANIYQKSMVEMMKEIKKSTGRCKLYREITSLPETHKSCDKETQTDKDDFKIKSTSNKITENANHFNPFSPIENGAKDAVKMIPPLKKNHILDCINNIQHINVIESSHNAIKSTDFLDCKIFGNNSDLVNDLKNNLLECKKTESGRVRSNEKQEDNGFSFLESKILVNSSETNSDFIMNPLEHKKNEAGKIKCNDTQQNKRLPSAGNKIFGNNSETLSDMLYNPLKPGKSEAGKVKYNDNQRNIKCPSDSKVSGNNSETFEDIQSNPLEHNRSVIGKVKCSDDKQENGKCSLLESKSFGDNSETFEDILFNPLQHKKSESGKEKYSDKQKNKKFSSFESDIFGCNSEIFNDILNPTQHKVTEENIKLNDKQTTDKTSSVECPLLGDDIETFEEIIYNPFSHKNIERKKIKSYEKYDKRKLSLIEDEKEKSLPVKKVCKERKRQIENTGSSLDDRLLSLATLFGDSETSQDCEIIEEYLPDKKARKACKSKQQVFDWHLEFIAQVCNLNKTLLQLNTEQRILVEKRFKDLFGGENDPVTNTNSGEIVYCRKRIADIVVAELTRFYVSCRIGSKYIFKQLAKHVTDDIMKKSLAPDAEEVRQTVNKIFDNGKLVVSTDDIPLVIE